MSKIGDDLSFLTPSDDEANKKLNLQMAIAEKLGLNPYGDAEPPEEEFDSRIFGDGWEEIVAPTENHERPRALAAGYHRKSQLLVIVFRPPKRNGGYSPSDAPMIVYVDTELDLWEDLKSTSSTGKWLKYSGVESNTYYPVDKAKLLEMVDDITNQN